MNWRNGHLWTSGRDRKKLREKFPIQNLPGICIIFCPPGFFARLAWWFGELQCLSSIFCLLLYNSEMVVIKKPHCFDHVRDSNPAVLDKQQIFSVGVVGRHGEVIGAHIDPGRRLVEIDDDELMMHPR